MPIKRFNDSNHFRICCFLYVVYLAFGFAKENILVYPTGLIATIITVYLLYQAAT
jgi:nicotinamide mononucleotide transporter